MEDGLAKPGLRCCRVFRCMAFTNDDDDDDDDDDNITSKRF